MAPPGPQPGSARHNERRQNKPGGPGGSPPNTPPQHGGKGYSDDDGERRLEWELDDRRRNGFGNCLPTPDGHWALSEATDMNDA